MNLVDEIYNRLLEIPVLDVHTHIDAAHLSARGMHDVLLYHMIVSELYSSGCPSGNRLSEEPDEEEKTRRIEEALPFLKNVWNTSCFWGVRLILGELYGWEEPITAGNWRELDRIIQAKSKEADWAREILRRGKVAKLCTELWRGKDGSADDLLTYCLEWAFFTRTQWKQYDTALVELENAWSLEEPGAPLPVNLDPGALRHGRKIVTLDEVDQAIEDYCNRIPYGRIVSTAQHFSTDIDYRYVTKDEMAAAIEKRDSATVVERDIYANYIMEAFLSKIEGLDRKMVIQFSCGAEPLPFETGSKMQSKTLFQLADIFERHPQINFQAFLANDQQSQAICTLVREFPNLSVAGYWWHNFYPYSIQQMISHRLDMLPLNKQIGFFSDAYCVDWCYAKTKIVRKQLAVVLAGKVSQGQYDLEGALAIAKQILHDTPEVFFYI